MEKFTIYYRHEGQLKTKEGPLSANDRLEQDAIVWSLENDQMTTEQYDEWVKGFQNSLAKQYLPPDAVITLVKFS